MKKTIAVTGASGFIGGYVISYIKERYSNYNIVAIGRYEAKLKALGCDYTLFDLKKQPKDCYEALGRPHIMIHLAWNNLNNYNNLSHIEEILPLHIKFVKSMIVGGLKSIAVTGTCYEYGNIDGCLSEDMRSNPTMSYSIAKDTLRRYIEVLNKECDFSYHWARIFFVYGEGQQERTLFGNFTKAMKNKAKSFDMSGGEQIRDYLHVSKLASSLVDLALSESDNGITNICSGVPVSIRKLVESWLEKYKKPMALNLGVYPYTSHEPFAFWGSNKRIKSMIGSYN